MNGERMVHHDWMFRFSFGAMIAFAASSLAQVSAPQTTVPLGPVEGFAAVLNAFPARLSLVDHHSREVLAVFATHRAANAVAVNVELDPAARAAYVLHTDNSITRLDLTVPTPDPITISPPVTAIFPGFIQTTRDFEISADGRYLLATMLNVGAWQAGIPIPRNRLSIYDLALGTDTHLMLDTVLNDLFLPELEIAFDAANRAYVTDGNFQQVVVIDLATKTVIGFYKGSDNDQISTPIGGSGSGPVLPCGTIAVSQDHPLWIAHYKTAGQGVLRRPGATFGTHLDTAYPGPDWREIEARPSTRYVALSRPKSTSFTQTAVDRIILVDLATGAACKTDTVFGTHRFREIEFFRDATDHKVYAIDFGANAFLVADFTPWIQSPGLATVPLASTSIPQSEFRFRIASDGLLADFGEYIVHDGEGRLGFFAIDPPSLLASVDTHLFHGARTSVDLELSTSVRVHQD
jgi:DNA-binding beta-propeller fold protein YncE